MGKPYSEELDYFSESFLWATKQNVELLRLFFNQWAGGHIYVVGSGGSYSAAYAIAELLETAENSYPRAVTPMEFIAKSKLISQSKAFLISSEGKNTDILAAAQFSKKYDISSAAFTLTLKNPLVDFANATKALRTFCFQMDWGKDGYLATNTLIATVLIFYQAIYGKIEENSFLRSCFDKKKLESTRQSLALNPVLRIAGSKNILVIHGPQTKLLAVDLESKLSESAITNVEVSDYRQFAHGRHLQLHNSQNKLCIVAVYSNDEESIAKDTINLIPSEVPLFHWKFLGASTQDIIIESILSACLITEAIAGGANIDPGQPYVPDYGRDIHNLDVSKYYFKDQKKESSKYRIAALRKTGGINLSEPELVEVITAAKIYESDVSSAIFKAIISDFDGTLCNPESRYIGMCSDIANLLSKLMDEGMQLALASGRGGSLHDNLRKAFDEKYHQQIIVGYYGGSTIQRLSDSFTCPPGNDEFLELLSWLKTTIYKSVCPEFNDAVRGGQLTIKLSNSTLSARLRLAIRAWISHNKVGWRVFNSGHSLDVLDEKTSKCNVIDFLSLNLKIDPNLEILCLGDNGDEDGNDYELLNHGFSLSSDKVSSSLQRCWNLSKSGCRHADATYSYIEALKKVKTGHQLNFTDNE